MDFNKKIKNWEIEKFSLVWVEFGDVKHLFFEKMKFENIDINSCPYGINLKKEFGYRHMGFMVSNKLNETVAIVPLTEHKASDDKFTNLNIVLDKNDFGLNLEKKSTVKLDQLRFVDKSRVVSVEKLMVHKTLKGLLSNKIQALF